MTSLSLRNPIAILMIAIAVVVFAGVTTPRMAVDTFPDLTPPVLVIGTLAPGLGAKDVEKTLTWRIEKYVSATPGVDHVQSISRNNLSIVWVWMKWGVDLDAAQTLVQQNTQFAMEAVPRSLGVLPPFVLQYDPSNAPVVQVVVRGGGLSGPQLYDFAQTEVEPLLEGIPGVASAGVNGGRARQINVVVDPVKAQARNVTSEEVAAAVKKANALLPSGELITHGFDANVYTNAIPNRIARIGDAPVKVVDGNAVLIRDVARVEDGGSPPTQSVSVDGKNGVYLNVLRIPGGNTIAIVDAVKDTIKHLKNLPPGLEVIPVFDASTFVRDAYSGMRREVVQALVLIALVILLFLQSMRGTLIVSIAIPLSFAVTLLVLYATGNTLNSFTLGGLTLAMGRLVDDAVVVLESIHRHQRMGLDNYQAALKGTNAVALPVLASTLTTMAVLLPVLMLAGLAKRLFVPLALTVAVAMTASYFVSMAVTPVACRYFIGHVEHGRIGKIVEGFIDRIADGYANLLRRVLPFQRTIIAGSVVLVGASVIVAARLPTTFFPEIDESMERIYVRVAPGTSLEDSTKEINAMADALKRELPPHTVKLALTNIGSPKHARSAMTSPNWGPHMGFIRMELTQPEERKYSQQEVADMSRHILVKDFPGVDFQQWPGGLVASVFANGYFSPLVLELRGDNLVELSKEADDVARVTRHVAGIRDVRNMLELDYPEVHIDTDRTTAGLVGVTSRDAAQSTLDATYGNINTPSVWVDPHNGEAYYVVTSYDRHAMNGESALSELPVRLDDEGRAVRLGTYADIHRDVGAVAIERNQLRRAAHIQMQVEGRDIGTVAKDIDKALKKDPRTRNVKVSWVGQVELMRDTFSGLGVALALAVMVVFMIMAAQFKSLRLPFVMLFTIPVSLVGIVLALMMAGQGFSIIALMGVLMVIGIAVSNGILLVDDANNRLVEGASKVEAVIGGARTRFVPIMMTSLATVIGLIPTAMALESGSEANQPLALSVVGGLTSSTFLSLFLVPVMFLIFAKVPESAAEQPA
jgi:multidrug efflux pump subunit AcrB